MISSWLWIVFTVAAAFCRALRNAMQRELTGNLGTVGATHVRFLFGFPFALLFLAGIVLVTGAALPTPGADVLAWGLDGAGMAHGSFGVDSAYLKTEPIQVALFGLVFLGDDVTPPMGAAIMIAAARV